MRFFSYIYIYIYILTFLHIILDKQLKQPETKQKIIQNQILDMCLKVFAKTKRKFLNKFTYIQNIFFVKYKFSFKEEEEKFEFKFFIYFPYFSQKTKTKNRRNKNSF